VFYPSSSAISSPASSTRTSGFTSSTSTDTSTNDRESSPLPAKRRRIATKHYNYEYTLEELSLCNCNKEDQLCEQCVKDLLHAALEDTQEDPEYSVLDFSASAEILETRARDVLYGDQSIRTGSKTLKSLQKYLPPHHSSKASVNRAVDLLVQKCDAELRIDPIRNKPVAIMYDGAEITLAANRNSRQRKQGFEMFLVCYQAQAHHLLTIPKPEHPYKAQDLYNSFKKELIERGGSLEKLCLLLNDATAENTGVTGGLNSIIERDIKKAVHRLNCTKHAIQTEFRHMCVEFFGTIHAHKSFERADVNKWLDAASNSRIVNFKRIEIDHEDDWEEVTSSNSDSQLFIDLRQIVIGVKKPEVIKDRTIPKFNNVRWLTGAINVLRAYISIPRPHKDLRLLVTYIICVFYRSWMRTMTHQYVEDYGWLTAQHLIATIKFIRDNDLSKRISEEAMVKTHLNNWTGLHPENFLLSLMNSKNDNCKAALAELSKKTWRERNPEEQSDQYSLLRDIKSSKWSLNLNVTEEDWFLIIDYKDVIYSPPLLREHATIGDIIKAQYYHHSQCVERTIRALERIAKFWHEKEENNRRNAVLDIYCQETNRKQ